ncbi:hypothetical protein ABPG72_015161 [Tetrahymena utriculariae]
MGNCCNKDKDDNNTQSVGAKSSLQIRRVPPQSQQVQETPTPQQKDTAQIKLVVNLAETVENQDTYQDTENTKRLSSGSAGSVGSRSSSSSRISANSRKNLSIQDFIIDRPLGKGAFGQVYLVTKKDNQKKYAMKTIKKIDMVKLQLIEATILEKTILLKSSHPFIVQLKYCIQTEKKIYLIMEYIQGGELFTLLKHCGQFTEKVAKFIIAEIILGIQYLHETLKIIYRDIKPENILLTKTGHIKISDFGLSKEFQNKDEKTFTFAGTPEYLAPEVVLNKGHNKNVDLWGIGVFLYELVAGYPPFQDKNRNYDKISKQIIMNRPTYPENFSPNLKDLIKKLLNSDPQMRLGANSFKDLKEHPFFYDIDWESLENLKVESPIKKFTSQEKPTKAAVRPRAIFETPLQTNIQLPQILGMTYDQDEVNEANKQNQAEDENELLKYKYDCNLNNN